MKKIDGILYFKMSELVDLTNTSKTTIQHYRNENLLPETYNTSKNMNYYPEITVSVISLIKYLQNNFNYSIQKIKEIFHYYKIDFTSKPELILNIIKSITFESKNQISKNNLNKELLEKLIDLNILEKKNNYSEKELEILNIYNSLKEYEQSEELIKDYIETGKRLSIIEKTITDNILEKTGDVPETLVLDVLTKLKPFILNTQTLNIYKGNK